jgi:hypothetical protein
MADHALDAVALSIEPLVVANDRLAMGPWRDDGLDAPILEVGTDSVGIVGFVSDERLGRLLGQIDQRVVALAVRRFARREMEGEGTASGIAETMNLTGEPAPRAAKSSSMNPPFPPAAET